METAKITINNPTQDQHDNQETLLEEFSAQRGHFVYESGYHGNLFLDLNKVISNPSALTVAIEGLSQQIAALEPDALCGCLTGGAFVAFTVACKLSLRFCWSSRAGRDTRKQLYPFEYNVEGNLDQLTGKRVVIVDDVVSTGSAALGTLDSLRSSGMEVVGLASFLTVGARGAELCRKENIRLLTLAKIDGQMWLPQDCPLCKAGETLVDISQKSEQLEWRLDRIYQTMVTWI